MKKPYLIAELSCNHEGDLNELFELIQIAKELKIDCVKIQSYLPNTISSDFKITSNTIWKNIKLKNIYNFAHTPRDWHEKIIEYCKKLEINLFTTVYSESDLKFIKKFKFNRLKIASFELSDLNLIDQVSKNSKDVLISNGMSYFYEIENAFRLIKRNNSWPTILHCNSGYPAKFDELDLSSIPFLKNYFKTKIGFSDHTLFENVEKLSNIEPWIAPLSAVYLGAELIEFHLIKDRAKSKNLFENKKGGFDWAFSKEKNEIEELIQNIKNINQKDFLDILSKKHLKLFNKMKGKVKLSPSKRELETLKYKPSLWTTKKIKKGEKLKFGYSKSCNFDSLRPSQGLDLKFFKFINGKRASKDLTNSHPLKLNDIIFD